MEMIEFHEFEWLDAPGVGDSVLAKTWTRLGLRINGREVIEFVDRRSGSIRHGVYGSVFPLAAWLVENWWNILYEPPIQPQIFEGARCPQRDEKKKRLFNDWMHRHNLLFAREGMALPDISMFRDEDHIVVRWLADPDVTGSGRFIGNGSARLERDAVESCLYEFVVSVLQRLEDADHGSDEVADMKANWLAIFDSRANEPELCQALAALGEDPYDPRHFDEQLMGVLQDRVLTLEPSLRHDLLGGTSPSTLEHDCECVARLNAPLEQLNGNGLTPWRVPDNLPMTRTAWAFKDGYERATYLRETLFDADHYTPISDLDAFISNRLGAFVNLQADCSTNRIDGLVACDANGRRVLVTPTVEKRPMSSMRFLEARALHQWLFTIGQQPSKRLLHRAHESEQRASRAFAAELLAPAAAIQRELDTRSEVRSIAEHFGVSELVILHQLENHRLSTPDE